METQLEREQGGGVALPPEHADPHRAHPTAREYVRIGLVLFVLTALEVATYYLKAQLGGWLLPTLFVLAFTKFSLVVLWFMHLRFDDRRYARFFVLGIAGAFTLYMIVLLLFETFLR